MTLEEPNLFFLSFIFKFIREHSNIAFLTFSSSLPMSNRMRKKMLKKTSYEKTKEEFESVKEKRRKKKEVSCFLYDLL